MASKSASLVQGVPPGSPRFGHEADFCTRRLMRLQSATLNIRTLDQLAKPRMLCLGIAGKIEHDGDTLRQEGANMWRGRVLHREEHFMNPGMSVISPGNRASQKSSCTRRRAFSRTAKSLARVDLPAAIIPQKKINFAEVLMLTCA
jgi:hypothetical protein